MCVRKGVLIMPKEVLDWREIQLVSRLTRNRKIKGTRAWRKSIYVWNQCISGICETKGVAWLRLNCFKSSFFALSVEMCEDWLRTWTISISETVVVTDTLWKCPGIQEVCKRNERKPKPHPMYQCINTTKRRLPKPERRNAMCNALWR